MLIIRLFRTLCRLCIFFESSACFSWMYRVTRYYQQNISFSVNKNIAFSVNNKNMTKNEFMCFSGGVESKDKKTISLVPIKMHRFMLDSEKKHLFIHLLLHKRLLLFFYPSTTTLIFWTLQHLFTKTTYSLICVISLAKKNDTQI